MTIRIVTDCAADLTPEEQQNYQIEEAPLFIRFPDGREVDAREIDPDDFYEQLAAFYPQIPTTAQPAPGIFSQIYERLLQEADEILSIHISSGLSGALNSAQNGAAAIQGKIITIWDSLTLSGGQRFQVLAAALAARAGWTRAQILERLNALRAQTEVIYTLETLEYLARGGRIGRVQALAGSLLKIKPVIFVAKEDGKYSTLGKNRTLKRNYQLMLEYLQEKYGNTTLWITVLHGKFEEAATAFSQVLQSGLNVARLEIGRISPVLGVHTGPGIVGAAVTPMHLLEDLLP